MKWRKRYHSQQDRKADQRMGFIICLVMNLVTFYVTAVLREADSGTGQTIALVLPWAVNLGFLLLALIFRPEMVVGYLVLLATLIVGGIGLSVLFLAACFTGVAVGIVFVMLNEALATIVICGVSGGLFLAGLFFGGRIFLSTIRQWWSGD
jgi:hypothetical protein